MFVFISEILECRIDCRTSNIFRSSEGISYFLFEENTCGMWRRQRHAILISVMCTLPIVYMLKLKYSGKMIKSYRFSMTPVKILLKVYYICLNIIPTQFAWKSDSILPVFFFHSFHFVLYAQCVYFCHLSAIQFGPQIHTLGNCVFKILV